MEPQTSGSAVGTVEAPVERVWRIAADFYDLTKWVPSVRECYEIEKGVRFVRTFPGQDGKITWVKERIVEMDAENYLLVYQMVEGNMGLENYNATLKLSEGNSATTLVQWSFVMSSASSKQKQEQEEFLRWGIQKLEQAASLKSPDQWQVGLNCL